MDEHTLVLSIKTYKEQVHQVESVLEAAGEENNEDLVKLRRDLHELITLTEESLLSLKKSKLLSLIDQKGFAQVQHSNYSPNIDDEFAAFQAEIAEEVNECGLPTHSLGSPIAPTAGTTVGENDGDHLDEIVGTRCCAPYEESWGGYQYHNCMIVGLECLQEDGEPKVRVMFCQPTHKAMLPCPFFLEDRCRFEDGTCRFSHGHVVEVTTLREYNEPDHSKLKVDSDCLAKDSDDLWYKAKVVEVQGDLYTVMFDSTDHVSTVNIEDIMLHPMEEASTTDLSDHESADQNQPISDRESDTEDQIPVYLWRPNQSTSVMGEWETHTKGVGSRLMSKMGYIVGQGLGRDSQGRTEPVPIQLLPQGKSLDKIMELKEMAGDQDLYDVLQKQKRKQKKLDKKAAESYKKSTPKADVFDFINKKLGHKKGDIHALAKNTHVKKSAHGPVRHISEKQLTTRTDKQLNVQMLQTHDAISRAEKEIVRLKDAVARNKDKEPAVASQLRRKLADIERHLSQLEASSSTIQSHKRSRSDHKKLTVF